MDTPPIGRATRFFGRVLPRSRARVPDAVAHCHKGDAGRRDCRLLRPGLTACRLTPISPPLSALRLSIARSSPCGAGHHPTARSNTRSRSPSVRSSFPDLVCAHWRSAQHLLRLKLRVAECERAGARGRETQSYPHTGLLMTGDVTEVRPLSPGSGKGPRHTGTRDRRGEERVDVPSTARAARPEVHDRAWRSSARLGAIAGELGPDGSS